MVSTAPSTEPCGTPLMDRTHVLEPQQENTQQILNFNSVFFSASREEKREGTERKGGGGDEDEERRRCEKKERRRGEEEEGGSGEDLQTAQNDLNHNIRGRRVQRRKSL